MNNAEKTIEQLKLGITLSKKDHSCNVYIPCVVMPIEIAEKLLNLLSAEMAEYFANRPLGDIIVNLRNEYGSKAVYDKSPEWLWRFVKRYELDDVFSGTREGALGYFKDDRKNKMPQQWPLPNLHLGVSISTQEEADRLIPILLSIQAAHYWLSLEPLLSDIIIPPELLKRISLVVVGAESGANRRPCKLEWIRNLVGQCKAAGVKTYIKQIPMWELIGNPPIFSEHQSFKHKPKQVIVHDINQFPEDLQVQEMI